MLVYKEVRIHAMNLVFEFFHARYYARCTRSRNSYNSLGATARKKRLDVQCQTSKNNKRAWAVYAEEGAEQNF